MRNAEVLNCLSKALAMEQKLNSPLLWTEYHSEAASEGVERLEPAWDPQQRPRARGGRAPRPRPRRRRRRAPLPRLRAHFRSAGPRRADRAPPPLRCSVIQTWKVNNTLTSPGLCVLTRLLPEYLAPPKRGALTRAAREGPAPGPRPLGGALPGAWAFAPGPSILGHQLEADGGLRPLRVWMHFKISFHTEHTGWLDGCKVYRAVIPVLLPRPHFTSKKMMFLFGLESTKSVRLQCFLENHLELISQEPIKQRPTQQKSLKRASFIFSSIICSGYQPRHSVSDDEGSL
ncbi:uncharacterized protein [Dipodomys merriami]|uniref:uncharacterized protein n=1 Tax=Dipodomys merriami TaxID=94247 RepID=UPI003855BFDD